MTLGLSRNQSVGGIKGNQATFDNSQQNNLRSCVLIAVVVSSEDVRAFCFFSRGEKEQCMYI